MKISLKELNEGFYSLQKAAKTVFPKEEHKLAYKLSRIYKSANSEVEQMQESLSDLHKKFEITPGDSTTDPAKLEAYGKAQREFLKETSIEIWGDPFGPDQWEIICATAELSPIDMANLDWLYKAPE